MVLLGSVFLIFSMHDKKLSLFYLIKARLSKRIVFWVFLSLIAIEAIILIPSAQRREQELLEQLTEVSSAKVSWLIQTYPMISSQEFIVQLRRLKIETMFGKIIGGILYDSQGKTLHQFGEIPSLDWEQVMSDRLKLKPHDLDRYDLAWKLEHIPGNYILILRHDVSLIGIELWAYKARIAGLVVLISLVVTSTTMFVLGKTVIFPVLQLRDDILGAGEALSQDLPTPDFYSCSVQRTDELGEVMQAFKQMFERVHQEIAERKQAEEMLRGEQQKSETLLLNILPTAIAKKLKNGENHIADGFASVTILFADIVGFTQLSQQTSPADLVQLLNHIFSAFDRLSEKHQLEKIKTIGDAYMVVGGLPIPRPDHAEAIAAMALDMQDAIADFNAQNKSDLTMRIGINTGAAIAGVIGTKKFIYDLWGDAVNTAYRMESHGIPGEIQVTESTYNLLKNKYSFQPRGKIHIKGKGKMTTYLLKKSDS